MAKEKRAKSDPPAVPGGYFTSLTLGNVRCFGSEQTLRLTNAQGAPAQWTVLLGDNGVGKTTVLQALAMIAPVAIPKNVRDRSTAELRPDVAAAINTLRDRPCAQGYFAFGLNPRELIRGGLQSFHILAQLDYSTRPGVAGGVRSHSRLTLSDGSVAVDTPPVPVTCAAYGGTRRLGSTALEERKDNPFATLFDDHAPLRNAEEWLIVADYAASKATTSGKRSQAHAELVRVKEALRDLLPRVHNLRIELSVATGGVPRAEVQTDDGWIPLRDLSLGYRTTIAWMVDLASRMFEAYPESPNPLGEPAVALVDEIDLHLHPRWQRDLLRHLTERFPRTQFIVTAHSPLVVQAAPDANIAVLRREGDQVVIDQDSGSVRGWRVDQILTSELFGLPSARDPQQDELRERREAILGKARLTNKDRATLAEIEAKLATEPSGETAQQREAMDVVMRAAARIKSAQGA